MNTRLWIFLCVSGALAQAAMAQPVWRCGPDGRQFTDKPCEQGQALDTALMPRPAADLAAAQDRARREQALAQQMARERQQQEAQRPLAAAGIRMAKAEEPPKPKPAPKPAPKRRAHHLADDGTWRAVAPSSRRAKG